MDDAPLNETLPPGIRLLKGLVIVLTLTLIAGVITVVGVIVTRMPSARPPPPLLPETLILPANTTAVAVTATDRWFAVVTADDRILIFDRNGQLQQEIPIALPPAP